MTEPGPMPMVSARMVQELRRRLPIGAEIAPGGGVHFRVWAPKRHAMDVIVDGRAKSMRAEGDGYYSVLVPDVGAGARYRYRVDGTTDAYPDPASRHQPDGPFGPSAVVDPSSYRWKDLDGGWRGISLAGQVFYELHIGTFTTEGTYAAAAAKL